MSALIDLDEELIGDLAFLGLSNRQISIVVGCDHTTFCHRGRILDILEQRRKDHEIALIDAWLLEPAAAHRSDERVERIASVIEKARLSPGWGRRERLRKTARTAVKQRKISE